MAKLILEISGNEEVLLKNLDSFSSNFGWKESNDQTQLEFSSQIIKDYIIGVVAQFQINKAQSEALTEISQQIKQESQTINLTAKIES